MTSSEMPFIPVVNMYQPQQQQHRKTLPDLLNIRQTIGRNKRWKMKQRFSQVLPNDL
eukprot:CAMPEP_0119568372 /NCGR_PEP_ID=MMETSP1352-20130426/38711_1 /TAXON_ID=265584 /ORGANISM="Stauroneis constricta, Strain CCMP1120" /LENGTH=56 /DNA_ID=CAMNT_0007617755 /DNA_START=223 /DNA_END=390 /DNA_ORIENTATION=+